MKTKKLAIGSMLVAMCLIGANVKLMGSVAFDSAPAFVGALLLGPVSGMALGFFGHLVSAVISGFPLSVPVHLITAAMMAVTMLAYSSIRRFLHNRTNTYITVLAAGGAAYLLNCPLSLLALYPLLNDMVFVLFPVLTIGAIVNIAAAELVYAALPAGWKVKFTNALRTSE